MVFIFNYEREEMFRQVYDHLKEFKPVVLDDGSSYFIENAIRFKNGGKQKFWEKWFFALKMAEGSEDDFFLFTPNDFLDLDIDRVLNLHEQLKDEPYVYNLINDGRDVCWDFRKPEPFDENTDRIYFTDCGFFCNRKALEMIRRFKREDISSGVGQQLTWKFNRLKVSMYRPKKSLAYHGDHESTMHKEQRKQIKLISK
jgi:hypothetical protein